MRRRLAQAVYCVLISLALFWGSPAWAATPEQLSVPQLQDRLTSPAKLDGRLTVDLRETRLDLQDEAFAQSFYALTQTALQVGAVPLSLDLSDAVILGDLDLTRLGLRTPLVGDGLSGLLPDAVQRQLMTDRNRANAVNSAISIYRGRLTLKNAVVTGQLKAANTYFLSEIEAQGARFVETVLGNQARFDGRVDFSAAELQQGAAFPEAVFFDRATFSQTRFSGETNFERAQFRDEGRFDQADFRAVSSFRRSDWKGPADFDQSRFAEAVSFARAQFSSALTLAEADLVGPVSWRQAQFGQAVNLRGAVLREQADFGDARFASEAVINVPELAFNTQTARILGTPGQIGRQFAVPTLTGNEAVLRSLVRNFRQLEQVADANQIEYMTQRLRLRRLAQQLRAVDLNRASFLQLSRLGLTAEQAEAVLNYRENAAFTRPADLLKLPEMVASDYWRVSDRVVTDVTPSLLGRLALAVRWLGLGLLLGLSRYGSSVGLVFGVGWVAIAPFALAYWWLDRDTTQPLPLSELVSPLLMYLGLVTTGIALIYQGSPTPGATLACLTLLVVPILAVTSYRLGPQRPGDPSYFTQDGSARQLRFLIARLPVMPEYYFFRDRYVRLVRSRRWNWLNYFDFSVNNSLRFGFNDTRLRDQAVPGILSLLVWYQWTLGVLYIALLLWTLSRTIPGLNLLLYF
ncbi:MAG: pentapeptide repeat-containing protein [Cyanobacteria bacterium J06628_6]